MVSGSAEHSDQRGFFNFCSARVYARAPTDKVNWREYAESSLTNATAQTTSIGGVYNSYLCSAVLGAN